MAITDNKSLNKNLCNVPVGGLSVKPRTNQRNFFDFDNEEKQTYYKKSFCEAGLE